MDYLIPRPIVEGSPQVFTYLVNGERVFVKKRRPAKNPLAWMMQRILYRLTGFLLILPPERPARNNVHYEAGVLRRLAGLGVRVPRVLYITDEYFVMSDAGRCLEVELRENPSMARHYIEKAARELRAFHDRGMAHGGAQIKNFTVCDGEICFIDFEESIPEGHLKKFMLRDLFLFIFSLQRTGHDPDLRDICAIYDNGEVRDTLEQVRRSLMQLRPVRLFKWSIFDRFSMRDVRSLIHLVDKADRLGRGDVDDGREG